MTETTSVADQIRSRIIADGKKFYAGDNISEFIKEGELPKMIDELQDAFENVLQKMVIDTENDPNSKGTARRMAKQYVNELFAGRYQPMPDCTSFPNVGHGRYQGMLVVKAEIRSLCSHHHQPVKGICYIGLLPGDHVIGLSKYARIAQWCARRGTLQEELAQEILHKIQDVTDARDVGVYIQASHGCMENRGVMAHDSRTTTICLSGQFFNPAVKTEFLDTIKLQENTR